MKKYNQMRAEDGQKPIDFEKLSAAVLKTIKDKFFEATGINPAVPRWILKKESKKILALKKHCLKKTMAPRQKKKRRLPKAGFEFNFDKKSKEGINNGEVIEDTDVNKYGLGAADINKTSSNSIFKVITTRYFKSAYPVLLEEN